MKMIPIVAVVPEDTFHAFNDLLSAHGEPEPAIAQVMAANGWTIDSIVAGSLITFAMQDAGAVRPGRNVRPAAPVHGVKAEGHDA